MGISHQEIIQVYLAIALTLGVPIATLSSCFYFWGPGFQSSITLSEASKVGAIIVTGPTITPFLMFQMEPRRPVITWIALIIINLFLGTAIFAHWLAILFLPILAYYAGNYQTSRYYRA